MPSPFDSAWESAAAAITATAGEWVTVNGRDMIGVVSTLESSSRGQPGLLVAQNACQIDISQDDATLAPAKKGVTVLARNRKLRVAAVHDLGQAGISLICEDFEQARPNF